ESLREPPLLLRVRLRQPAPNRVIEKVSFMPERSKCVARQSMLTRQACKKIGADANPEMLVVEVRPVWGWSLAYDQDSEAVRAQRRFDPKLIERMHLAAALARHQRRNDHTMPTSTSKSCAVSFRVPWTSHAHGPDGSRFLNASRRERSVLSI